jgi:uncharacterized protein YwgA
LDEPSIIILALYAAEGTMEGKTTLQKWCYFASVKTGLDLGYEPHFYGPYSKTIARATDELIASDFILERGRITQHDRVIYTYTLTNDGMSIARDLVKQFPKLYKVLEEIARTCNETVGNNISILSWAAKIYYLLQKKGKQITYEEIEKIGTNLGWELSEREIDSGVKLLSALRLARKD